MRVDIIEIKGALMKPVNKVLASLAAMIAFPIAAWAAGDPVVNASPVATATAASATDTMSDGEVKKVDKEAGKVTIKHGPLANLEMPGMTMVFHVKDSAMLDTVKPGDKIKFIAEKVGGALTVTSMQAAK
jgi:Cu(I)/Ag(I) efflux system protein CusF